VIDAAGDRQDVLHRALQDFDRVASLLRRRLAQEAFELGTRRAAPGGVFLQPGDTGNQAFRRGIGQPPHGVRRQGQAGLVLTQVVGHRSSGEKCWRRG